MQCSLRLIIVLLFCSTIQRSSQANEPKASEISEKGAAGSTVTGHVYLDDTKSPARRAQVYLKPAVSLEADAPPQRNVGGEKGPVTASVETRFDGSYAFTHVAAGSYYVVATYPGYISPFLELQLAENRSPYEEWAPLGPEQKSAKSRILHSLPRVDVQSNLPASVDLTLERGAAVSGNVSYDDGGPAAGLRISVLTRTGEAGKENWIALNLHSGSFSFFDLLFTDDRGNYRISGLPAGKYVMEADVEFQNMRSYSSSSGGGVSTSSGPSDLLPIYSGSTPRKKDAAGFSLQAREERTGEDIVIPMSKLHTIKGNIVSARDGHVVNGGAVILMNTDDHSLGGQQSLREDDPSFAFGSIFEGEYILSAQFPSDVDYIPMSRPSGSLGPPQFDAHVRRFYGSASMPLHVDGDMDGVTIAVPEATAKEAEFLQNILRQQEQRRTGTVSEPQ